MFDTIRRLTQHTLIYGAGHILTRGLGFILLPLYTHTLSQEEFGLVSLLFAYLAAMTILYGFGIDSAFLRYYVLAQSEAEKREVFAAAYVLVAAAAALFSFVHWLGAAPLARFVLEESARAPLLLLCAGILCCDALAAFPFLLFRAEERSHWFAINKFLNVALNLALSYVLLVYCKRGIAGVLEANLLASAFTFITLLPTSLRRLQFKLAAATCAKLARYGLPYLPATLGIVAIDNMDRYILKALTDLKAVGLYSAGYRLGIVMGLLIAAFRFAWMPFSLNVARTENARALYARVLTYFITVCAFIFLGFSFFIDDLVRFRLGTFTLIAPDYWPGAVVVPVIMLGYWCYGVFVNLLVGIHLEEKTIYLPLLTGCGALLNAGLNFALIPWLGMLGAAWATALAYAAMMVWGYFLAQKIYPVAYEWRRLIKVAALTLALFLVDKSLGLNIWLRACLLLSFPFLLWLIGFFEQSELQRAKNWLQRFRSSQKHE
jgi:O-antigen/teichoic acid export membrane protein